MIKITLMMKRTRRLSMVSFGLPVFLGVCTLILLGVIGLQLTGFYYGKFSEPTAFYPASPFAAHNPQSKQSESSEALRSEALRKVLSERLGKLQAKIVHLNSLAGRLTEVASIDPKLFNFDQPPAMGGPVLAPGKTQVDVNTRQLQTRLEKLDRELSKRRIQFDVLGEFFLAENARKQTFPSGWPIRNGWISSQFGMRTNPVHGKRSMHHGLDLVPEQGDDVIAVAKGVVSFAGVKTGYGQTVELDHGNGYITRYAHHKKILVKLGDVVKRGQTIAKVGHSGINTGDHVHFEVIKSGNAIDPVKFIQTRL